MDQQRPIVLLAGSRQEHELFMMGYSAIFGAYALFGGKATSVVFAYMDALSLRLWAAFLLLSGVLGLAGCLWRGSVATRFFLEQVGLYVNSGCVFVFGGLALQLAGPRAFFTSGICAAWILANVSRALWVRKDQRDLRGAPDASDT